jgi:hypothetical protein
VGAWVGFTLSAVGWNIGFMLGIPYVLFYPLSWPKNICPDGFLICRNARFFRYLFLKSSAYFNGTKMKKKIILLFIEAHNCCIVSFG